MFRRCFYRYCGLALHCTPTLQTPSTDLSLQTSIADLQFRPRVHTLRTLQTYFVDLRGRVTILSLLWRFGWGPSHNPFSALASWGRSELQCFPRPWSFGGGAAAEVMYYNVLAPALQKACSKVAGSTMLPAAKEIPNYILRHGLLACANCTKILRRCALANSFASGRYWTPTGRLLDALLDALLDGEANPSLRYKPEKSSS